MTTSIQHEPGSHRFATTVDGHTGYVEYSQQGDTLSINHTIVPTEIGGRGIAGELVKAALDYAQAKGLRVHPACSYADGYMQRHSEYNGLRV